MARERYLVNAEEDTIHRNQIVLTDKWDKRKNWWHYHKIHLLLAAVGVIIIISFVYSISTQVKPDYTIAFLTSYVWPDETMEELRQHMGRYGEDVNGDGKIELRIAPYLIGNVDSESVEPNQLQAAVVKMTADISEMESVIFIHDDASFSYLAKGGAEGLFLYRDGTPMPDNALDFEKTFWSWSEIKGLEAFHVASSPIEYLSAKEIDEVFRRNRISVRSLTDRNAAQKDRLASYDAALAFFNRLKMDEPVKVEEKSGGN